LYVGNQANSASTVTVIDTSTNNTVGSPIPVYPNPNGLAVTPDGNKVFVTSASSNNVSVIDTATAAVVATIPVGSGPYAAAVSPDGTKVYVSNQTGNAI